MTSIERTVCRFCSFVALTLAGAAAVSAASKPMSENATSTTTLSPDAGRMVVDVKGVPPPAPLFFSASADQAVVAGSGGCTTEVRLRLHVVQGKPERLTVGLSGEGEVLAVSGKGLRDWSVRQVTGAPAGRRLIDLRPELTAGTPDPTDFEFSLRIRRPHDTLPASAAVALVTPGDAVGLASQINLSSDGTVDLRVTSAAGLVALGDSPSPAEAQRFYSTGDARLEIRLSPRGAAAADAELLGAQLSGRLVDGARSVDLRLRGQFRAQKAGARLRFLAGHAALSEKALGDGWHVELAPADGNGFAYDLVADRDGVFPVDLPIAAEVREEGDWRQLDFTMPAGAVVPLVLEGLGSEVHFKPDSPIVPVAAGAAWQGFLPADGRALVAWRRNREAGEGALFFTSSELTDVRVGAGLLRQSASLSLRVLQGKLPGVRIRVEGPGEILGVDGDHVVGWKLLPGEGARVLEIRFSRPVENEGTLVIRSQTELGAYPVRAEPLRLVPEGVVRHAGFLRVANSGAVRLEVTDVAGLMQLAPGQFPGPAAEAGARQVFVYRFPSAAYGYRVLAAQIQPEVGVSQITTYQLGETDRLIQASLELDVREAPLRDWSLEIPDDYTVVGLSGGSVSDYVVESTAAGGYRVLKVLFQKAVEGRELIELRLEKNQSAGAGEWQLRPLRFPAAKTVRGHIGVVSTPGYRLAPASIDRLAEVPLSYFPNQIAGLQQAWRLREPQWSAAVRIEALGQSIQADVFHLYSIKEGVVYGSVLLNYFVVGAPANEWRLEVPAALGNIDVIGQNVRRDWRREGDQVIVSLHQPVLGAATLLVTFEQPMSARGGALQPGQVRPLGVQSERGYVEIVSPLQVKHEVRVAEGGLLKLEPAELPAEIRLLSTSPALAVYQYTARPFKLEVGVEWYAAGETVDQVVDFAKLSSQVSRNGEVITDAQYYVKTRGRKALRLILPEGVKLWEARVDNEIAQARVDGEQTLIPLPAKLNPAEPVAVSLRLGQPAGRSAAVVKLLAPRALASTVVSEWVLRADAGRLLVPRSSNADLTQVSLTETGFEWIARNGRMPVAVLLLGLGLAAFALRAESGGARGFGFLLSLLVCAGALLLAASIALASHRNVPQLAYSVTMVPAGEAVFVEVGNAGEFRSLLSFPGLAAVAAGLAVLVAAGRVSAALPRALATALAAMLVSAGLLAQRGGGVYFFGGLAAVVFLGWSVPAIRRWWRERATAEEPPPPPPPGGSGVQGALPLILCLGTLAALALGGAPEVRADAPPPPKTWSREGARAAQSVVQTWSVRGDRLFGEMEFAVRGAPGDSFLLLNAPAVLTDFKGEGLRVGKVERDGSTAYFVAPERAGVLTARVKFEMPVPERAQGIAVPTGPAAAQRITIELDQAGWDFGSAAAVQVLPAVAGENRSGATLVLAPFGAPVIQLIPKSRDISREATQFFTEAANLYVPGPGVVNGYSRITVRPVQGRVSELLIDVPPGLTVGDVARGPVGAWRFDPQKRQLHVAIEPAQSRAFRLDVETQLGTGALPFDLTLQPLRVTGAAGDVGTLALAFGGDAQPEAVRPRDISTVNLQDFDAALLPRGRDGQSAAVLQHVWRYGQAGGAVDLKIAPVAPEVRVAGRQVISLDDDRQVMAMDLNVAILRVGLFKLSFVLPEGLEVEALSGASLSHWTEAQEDGRRVVTLHLNGRTLGEQSFSLTLAGAAPRAQGAWPVPRLTLREATRQTGDVLIVPGKGLRLRAVDREKVTQLDPRSVGGMQPGTLAFRLLQDDWVLRLGIESLEPWVTLHALTEVTLREGQSLTRLALRYRVENAAVKALRVRLPGLDAERVRTVRATGSAVSEIVRVADAPDLWEIHFQRGIAGETDVQIEFQGPAGERNGESVAAPEFPGARQAVQFVSLRAGGRLELGTGDVPRGWTRVDWSAVPANLQDRGDRSVPALCYRVAEPERPLAVSVRRHDVADALKLRVTRGDLTSLFSPAGDSLTAVQLQFDVLEKSTLRVRLPERARLFNTFVNGQSVTVVREGDAYLFHVTPSTGDRTASVRLVYAAEAAGRGVRLSGPRLNVPLENVTWRVVLPPGYSLRKYEGELRLEDERTLGDFGVEEYRSMIVSKRSADAQQAVALLQEASSLLQSGDQQKASEVLSRASNAPTLDEATNEDARVQLRNLKTQQTVLGLNTRRQRMYLDNRLDAARNEQLEQAASLNPFMQGKVNFDPQQVDQLLMGNTVEENAALRGIAARLVDQQLASEPAPGAIDVTLPQRGRVLVFTRSVQVDGGAPLALGLRIQKTVESGRVFTVLMLLTLGAIVLVPFGKRAGARPEAQE